MIRQWGYVRECDASCTYKYSASLYSATVLYQSSTALAFLRNIAENMGGVILNKQTDSVGDRHYRLMIMTKSVPSYGKQNRRFSTLAIGSQSNWTSISVSSSVELLTCMTYGSVGK